MWVVDNRRLLGSADSSVGCPLPGKYTRATIEAESQQPKARTRGLTIAGGSEANLATSPVKRDGLHRRDQLVAVIWVGCSSERQRRSGCSVVCESGDIIHCGAISAYCAWARLLTA
eukprot:284408-Prymnesium_polylepis.2